MNKSASDLKEYEIELDLPEEQKVHITDYAMNPRKYTNAIIENIEGIPESIRDLDVISLRQIMNFVSKEECPYTGKSTYMNKVASFINSGFYSDEYLNKVFGKKYIVKSRKTKKGYTSDSGNFNEEEDISEIKYYIKDRLEYSKIEMAALQNWESKELGIVFDEYFSFKYNKLNKEMIEQTILTGINEAQDDNTKLKYIKMAIDIMGLNKGKNNVSMINVYTEGGGRGLSKRMAQVSGNDNFVLGVEDDD